MTISEIAREVGCSNISVYNYLDKLFPNLPVMPSSGTVVGTQIPQDKAETLISAMRWAGLGPPEKAPGPKVRELAATLGVSESLTWRLVGELCPNHNVRLSPEEVGKVTRAIQNRRPKVSRHLPKVSNGVTVSELAKRLEVNRNTVLRVLYAKFPASKGHGVTSTGGRRAIVISAPQAAVISEEVTGLKGIDGKLRLGPKLGISNLRHASKRSKPKPPVTPQHEEPLPPIEDVVMQVLEYQESKPCYSINVGDLARAFRWNVEELRYCIYTRFPQMLASSGRNSTALTPDKLLHIVTSGLQQAKNGERTVQR